jgi:acyl-CoA thioesterase II
MSAVQELIEILDLEPLEVNLFRGRSPQSRWQRVFGGQVIGQALVAACRTVEDVATRPPHSLHAYFLLGGDPKVPIVYEVDRIRDGASFTTRRVVAIQRGKAIFNLAASFQKAEEGFEHADAMPEVPAPEYLPTELERLERAKKEIPEPLLSAGRRPRPFEMRTNDPLEDHPFRPSRRPPKRAVWLKTIESLPEDPALHRYLLAYASDHLFVTTSLLPHGVNWLTPGMQVASLDHVMWFLRPVRVDEWLLYDIESPSAYGARGLARGRIFARDGRLVAITAQEGLIRKRAAP